MGFPEDTKQTQRISRGSKQCPVGIDLATPGRKWTVHILESIGVLHIDRFNQILRSLPGLTPRVLIMRLNELEESGLITPIIIQESPKLVGWTLTEKGQDTLPILEGYFSFTKMASKRDLEESPHRFAETAESSRTSRRTETRNGWLEI